MTALEKGNRLHDVMKTWNDGMFDIKNGYLKLGQAIHIIKTEKLWKLMQIETFPQFCAGELHVSLAQANRLEQIYRELGYLLENITIDIAKVTLLLPYLTGKTEDEKRDILTSAKDLTVENIKNNLKTASGKDHLATDVCEHEGEIEMWTKCVLCGKFFRE